MGVGGESGQGEEKVKEEVGKKGCSGSRMSVVTRRCVVGNDMVINGGVYSVRRR